MSQNFTYYKDQKPNQTGNKYTDDLFPPNEKSLLGLDSNGTPIDQEAYNKAIGGLINKDNISNNITTNIKIISPNFFLFISIPLICFFL